ncbi:hypothetical protein FRC11_002085 [Ceratobasidium sp. 423]|nr:hypothetical protein FRC11_002085 [Ceratobasidium sp. 423]
MLVWFRLNFDLAKIVAEHRQKSGFLDAFVVLGTQAMKMDSINKKFSNTLLPPFSGLPTLFTRDSDPKEVAKALKVLRKKDEMRWWNNLIHPEDGILKEKVSARLKLVRRDNPTPPSIEKFASHKRELSDSVAETNKMRSQPRQKTQSNTQEVEEGEIIEEKATYTNTPDTQGNFTMAQSSGEQVPPKNPR